MDSNELQQLRIATQIENEAKSKLESLGPGSAIMAAKRPVVQDAADFVSTNVYGVTFPNLFVYRYDVAFVGNSFSGKELIDRHAVCRDLFLYFKANNQNFWKATGQNHLYYDMQSILYSVNELDEIGSSFVIPPDITPTIRALKFQSIKLCLRKALAGQRVELSVLNKMAIEDSDTSLEQFLNLVTSQHIMLDPENYVTFSASRFYLMEPHHYGFGPNDSAIFPDNGSYLGIGAQKSVRLIEGPHSKGNMGSDFF